MCVRATEGETGEDGEPGGGGEARARDTETRDRVMPTGETRDRGGRHLRDSKAVVDRVTALHSDKRQKAGRHSDGESFRR